MKNDIIQRLYNVLPPRTLALQHFFALTDIELTSDVQTAAITCETIPKLRLNPDFIAAFCQTDEHLFMLVMHELYHVILGHTSLFPHPSETLNIAFDAVINAILCHDYPTQEYTSFFTNLYHADKMPEALLRPPDGNAQIDNLKATECLRMLYTKSDAITYYDIFQILRDLELQASELSFPLLGSHGDGTQEILAPAVKPLIEGIIAEWPNPPFDSAGRSGGGKTREKQATLDKVSPQMRKNLIRLMRTAGLNDHNWHVQRQQLVLAPISAVTFGTDLKDRTAEARRLLMGEILLCHTQMSAKMTRRTNTAPTFVYLDVSGSMSDILCQILPFFRRPAKTRECRLFGFSTEVAPMTATQIATGEFTTTGGTNICCVLEHCLKQKRAPANIIVITDGMTGTPPDELMEQLKKRKIKMHCGIVSLDSSTYNDCELRESANTTILL